MFNQWGYQTLISIKITPIAILGLKTPDITTKPTTLLKDYLFHMCFENNLPKLENTFFWTMQNVNKD